MNLREELEQNRASDVAYLLDVLLAGKASYYGNRRDLCRLLKIASEKRGSHSCWSEGYLISIMESLSKHLPQMGITFYREGTKLVLARVGHPAEPEPPDTARFLPVVCDDRPDELPAIAPTVPPVENIPPPIVTLKGETSVILKARGHRSIRVTGTISDITHIAIGLAFAP